MRADKEHKALTRTEQVIDINLTKGRYPKNG